MVGRTIQVLVKNTTVTPEKSKVGYPRGQSWGPSCSSYISTMWHLTSPVAISFFADNLKVFMKLAKDPPQTIAEQLQKDINLLHSTAQSWGLMMKPSPAQAISHPSTAQGGLVRPPLAVSPLIELELRGKNERVARRETKRLIYKLKVLGQPVTSEVMSSAEKCRKP